jgi:hypothetical protein
LAQWRRPEPVAIAARSDDFGTPALGQYESGQHPASRPEVDWIFRDPPVERRTVPQHDVDMTGYVWAVLGADVAPAPEIIGRDIVGRPFARVDRGQNIDRGGDLRARCQAYPVRGRSTPRNSPLPHRGRGCLAQRGG